MRRVMVRYEVKPDRADENKRYIEAVFAQLATDKPAGLRYASFCQADGVSFVHIASIETQDGTNPLALLDAFKAFTAKIADRCAAPPVTTELHEIGAYAFFGS